MDVSKFLGKLIGLYLIIISCAMLLHMQQILSDSNNAVNDSPLLFITGAFTLFLGLGLVISHNIWEWHWKVIITIFSWITLLKGASILLYPQFISQTTLLFAENTGFAYVVAFFDLIIGILLCRFAFRRI